MNDLLPDDVTAWQDLEYVARRVFGAHGYQEIRTPLLEQTELFERGVGDTSDIVQKEMYTFENRAPVRGDVKRFTLRPEGTASVVRAYVEHKMWGAGGETRLFYTGPMFRHEQPQKGRYRQFHQVGCEAFGVSAPGLDVEMLSMLQLFLLELGITDAQVELNTLGCIVCRPAGVSALRAHLEPHREALCEDCRLRLDRNPLRVLDCKVEADRLLVQSAPTLLSAVTTCPQGCGAHFAEVQTGLHAVQVPYTINPLLVRGLDYYTRTVFEVKSHKLGAQSAVCAGGRYDKLVEDLGGPPTPAIGFAAGVERLLMLQPEKSAPPKPTLSVVLAEESARIPGLVLAQTLRRLGVSCDLDHQPKSVKSQMRRADRAGSVFCVVLGSREIGTGRVQLKNLRGGASNEVALQAEAIVNAVRFPAGGTGVAET
jgi:histidyl-tRNA synthetase